MRFWKFLTILPVTICAASRFRLFPCPFLPFPPDNSPFPRPIPSPPPEIVSSIRALFPHGYGILYAHRGNAGKEGNGGTQLLENALVRSRLYMNFTKRGIWITYSSDSNKRFLHNTVVLQGAVTQWPGGVMPMNSFDKLGSCSFYRERSPPATTRCREGGFG